MLYTNLIFILGLFPISAMLSFLDRSAEYKNLILIITSLLFFSWGKPFAICLIMLSSLADWGLGALCSKFKDHNALPKLFLGCDALIDLIILFIFDHNYLFIGKLSFSSALLPVTTFYYCLRGFSYVYDVYRSNINAEKNFFCLLTYMCSFHLMLAGPAVRYGEAEPQIRKREITLPMLSKGLTKIFIGFAKVVIPAEIFSAVKLAGLNGDTVTILGSWIGMAAFFAEYYLTFSGLCDMSIGMGLTNGFKYPENYMTINFDGKITSLVKTFNTTIICFFAELFGLKSDKNKTVKILGSAICGLTIGILYKTDLNFAVAGILVGTLCGIELAYSDKIKLAKPIKIIVLSLATFALFGMTYFDSLSGYEKWLISLVGIGADSFTSKSLTKTLLNNLTIIVISFFVIFEPLKSLISKALKNLSDRSVRYYGLIRLIKTVMTAFVFLLGIITVSSKFIS